VILDAGIAVLKIAGKAVGLLKDAGIVKSPEDEAKAQALISDIYIKELQAQTEFFKADQTAQDPAWVAGLRASVRPIITFMVVGLWFWNKMAFMYGKTQFKFDQWDMALLGTVITFYFGGRMFEKMKDKDR